MAEGGRSRLRQSIGDMVRSLAVVVGLVGVVVLATSFLGRDPVRDIDYASTLDSARVAAPYEVLAPEGLEGFRATTVEFTADGDATVWHLGFATPEDEYIGLDQTDGDPTTFITTLTEGATEDGSVTVDGKSWERYSGGGSSPDEDLRGLALRRDGDTVLVSGTAEFSELEAFAAALEAD